MIKCGNITTNTKNLGQLSSVATLQVPLYPSVGIEIRVCQKIIEIIADHSVQDISPSCQISMFHLLDNTYALGTMKNVF